MNHLAVTGEGSWHLPRHAHVVAYAGDRPLLTIYRCGADASPAAQFRGALSHVDAAHERLDQPTGAIVKFHEPAILHQIDSDRFVVRR